MREERSIIITMNPDQLRKLADKMEKIYSKLTFFNTTFVDFLGHTPELRVCLHLDQEWFIEAKKAELMPEPTTGGKTEFCFDPADVTIRPSKTSLESGLGQIAIVGIEVTHMPSGTRALCDDFKSMQLNKREALKKLDKLLRIS